MTMIVNKQPEPSPVTPPATPTIANRDWLESADGTTILLRWAGHIVLIAFGTIGLVNANGLWPGILVVLSTGAVVATWELATIAVRALLAIAWAARKPDGQP